jgi:hypothetical protein
MDVAPGIGAVRDEHGLFCVDVPELNIHIEEPSEARTYELLSQKVFKLWDRYVVSEDRELTPEEIKLRKHLTEKFLEVRVCEICGGEVRPAQLPFAIQDDEGGWSHLRCVRSYLPRALRLQHEAQHAELGKLRSLLEGLKPR